MRIRRRGKTCLQLLCKLLVIDVFDRPYLTERTFCLTKILAGNHKLAITDTKTGFMGFNAKYLVHMASDVFG